MDAVIISGTKHQHRDEIPMSNHVFLTVPEVARLLGVHPERIREWTNREIDPLPALHLPGVRNNRYHRDAVLVWASSLKPFNV